MFQEERLHALDAVRAFALLLGIAFHASLQFVPGIPPGAWAMIDISQDAAPGVESVTTGPGIGGVLSPERLVSSGARWSSICPDARSIAWREPRPTARSPSSRAQARPSCPRLATAAAFPPCARRSTVATPCCSSTPVRP